MAALPVHRSTRRLPSRHGSCETTATLGCGLPSQQASVSSVRIPQLPLIFLKVPSTGDTAGPSVEKQAIVPSVLIAHGPLTAVKVPSGDGSWPRSAVHHTSSPPVRMAHARSSPTSTDSNVPGMAGSPSLSSAAGQHSRCASDSMAHTVARPTLTVTKDPSCSSTSPPRLQHEVVASSRTPHARSRPTEMDVNRPSGDSSPSPQQVTAPLPSRAHASEPTLNAENAPAGGSSIVVSPLCQQWIVPST